MSGQFLQRLRLLASWLADLLATLRSLLLGRPRGIPPPLSGSHRDESEAPSLAAAEEGVPDAEAQDREPTLRPLESEQLATAPELAPDEAEELPPAPVEKRSVPAGERAFTKLTLKLDKGLPRGQDELVPEEEAPKEEAQPTLDEATQSGQAVRGIRARAGREDVSPGAGVGKRGNERKKATRTVQVRRQAGGTSPPPERRGGRPRGPMPASGTEQPEEGSEGRRLKPELVCWERLRQWIVGIEVPEEVSAHPHLAVFQNGTLLTEEADYPGRYPLVSLSGTVTVRANGSEVLATLELCHDYLLFKLAAGRGHRVNSATRGCYLVVAPESWCWDEQTSGPPAIAPEPVSVEEFRAHFLDVGRSAGSAVTFLVPNGQRKKIHFERQRFRLRGKELADFSERVGPLFGGAPPALAARDPEDWSNITTVVLGEEGQGRNRWRTHFAPQYGVQAQQLPDELMRRGGGWYFIRFYDNDDRLVDSLDFRFLSALNDIRIHDHPMLASSGGHDPVDVEFVHQQGCSVLLDQTSDGLTVRREGERTIITVPPKPEWDRVHCCVQAGNASVEVSVATRRTWWAVGEEDVEPVDWADTPVEVRRKWFRATSTKTLWLRLPMAREVDKVCLGFQQATVRCYRAPVNRHEFAIPLREFGDCAEIEDFAQGSTLVLWLDTPEADHGVPIIRVIARLKCKQGMCAFESATEEHMVSHIEANHASSLVRRIRDYQELRSILPELRNLPPYIHKCCKCRSYFPSDDNRPDRILRDHDCSKVGAHFEVIRDADQIRREVFRHLPEVYKCKWECVLKGPTKPDILRHLLDHHRDQLYECD